MPKQTRATIVHTFNVTADVISGTIRLTGDITGDTIEVPRGDSGQVLIADTADWYLYASVNASGGVAGCWGRAAVGAADNTFTDVQSDTYNIVYAVAKTSPSMVTYGPVITIKPKG